MPNVAHVRPRASHFGGVERQNRIKYGRVMPILRLGKIGILTYFAPKVGHVGHIFGDMDFKFVLPVINIDIEGQTKLVV